MKEVFQFRTRFRSKSVRYSYLIILPLTFFSCQSDPQSRPSPLRSDSTNIRGTYAYIEFSSPGVKGRKIFGNGEDYLVPFGEMWRTGANNASYIHISDKIKIDSFMLDQGKYSLFTIPAEEEWTIIFNKEWDQWGSYNYKDSLDVFRLNVRPRYADQVQERMLFYFADDSLKFRWDKVRWAIPFTNP